MIREWRTVTAHLLTGFLGSGKTSLLQRLLALPDLAGTAVLINEFGEIGLDHLLVDKVDGPVVLLKSGCVCCSIRGDLRDGLERLHGRMESGEIPPFERAVIETTGLADPVPIVAGFTKDPALRWHFRLGKVVTVVDAVNGLANLDRFPEAVRQVALADRLVVSKTDLADPAPLLRRLRALNPTAMLHLSTAEAAAPGALLRDEGPDRAAELDRLARIEPDRHDHHAQGLVTFCLTADAPLDWAAFGLWLSLLLHAHGAAILRVKGLLHVSGVDRPVLVQGVQHLVHQPLHLEAWPDGVPRTRLVVIGVGLDRSALERSFRAFCRPGGEAGDLPS